ncbi:MAG TPA: peptidoglycan-associated lipoprotein Pal [Myxococcota bacterium]|nr:peptidoglycan-associated lipoprotein Pal [Myxococcota bacterium]
MKTVGSLSKGLAFTAAVLFVFSFLATGCRPPFPKCRDDGDCADEKGNTTQMKCCNENCQECCQDPDCPKERPKCKDMRCVECVENKDCPEDKPFCENEKCVFECEIDSDCETRGKPGMVCKEHKCQWECEKDEDCAEGMECKDHHCVPKCKCQTDADCPEGNMCKDCECVEKPKCEVQTIHFDFNRYNLRSEDREVLDRNGECLKERADMSVSIEGHCDDRGTEEYNIALGDKRARAAKKYLVNLGVAKSRLKTISYGEGRPVCSEQTEDCWAQNRRCEFSE